MAARQDVEVELKFQAPDSERVRSAIRELGGWPGEALQQIDTYFAHPLRDFAKTDEALRVRMVGDAGCTTYKGPLLDAVTKSREETEVWFAGGAIDAERFGRVLERLGFRPVRSVRKRRVPWSLTWESHRVEVAFDRVEDLGDFVELETGTSTEGYEEAKRSLLALAEHLQLKSPERRSYLSMLLAQDAACGTRPST
jgi:adenylate cyclase, class 2